MDDLVEILEASGARVTFDLGRDITKPCTFCAEPAPPEGHQLRDIGTYYNGNTITRPCCKRHAAALDAAKAKEPTK